MTRQAVWWKFADVLEMLTASIIRAVVHEIRTSETSVYFYRPTRRNIPEDSHLHTRRRENLKSQRNFK
jgi:hypothetical protein